MLRKVTFNNRGLKVAGVLYYPRDYRRGEKRPGIVTGHPTGGVKEQTAGLYSRRLADKGFITLAYDCTYQGESEGEPRHLEDPSARVEDIKSAVSFLSSLEEVDAERIGGLGICASGGYLPFAAQTDRRIKAVATVSAVCLGTMYREGLGGGQSREALAAILDAAAMDRTDQAKGRPPVLQHIVPSTAAEMTKDTPQGFREAFEYYRTPRAQHPNSQNFQVVSSMDLIIGYESYERMNLISPRPLLMIAGTEADTRYFSEKAIGKAQEPKELFLIKGATHVALYDKEEYVGPALSKIESFFKQHLVNKVA